MNQHGNTNKLFWRDNPYCELDTYALKTVTYGTTSAPYLAIRSLTQLAYDSENLFPLESQIIKECFYVDDVLTGANSKDELLQIKFNLEEILKQGGFELSKWCSNNQILKGDCYENVQIGDSLCKKLGIWWDIQNDVFTYNVNLKENSAITKRTILALTSQLFDPLGFLVPIIIIIAKFILQGLWTLELGWDESVPIEMGTQ